LPVTRDSQVLHQLGLQVIHNLTATPSNTNKHDIGKINITPIMRTY
jgi:regulator of RNase E activity RraA